MIAHQIDCTIQRRLLINYRIDPDQVAALLPAPLRPQIVRGWAVGGVCCLRLSDIRAGRSLRAPGFCPENVAHRFAVEWDCDEGTQSGVYIPRRDSNSRLISLAGGVVFPSDHRRARFSVSERDCEFRIAMVSSDLAVRVAVVAREATEFHSTLFGTLDDAVSFFRAGTLGLSPNRRTRGLDRVLLHSGQWDAQAVTLETMSSSLFDDQGLFPHGTCALDCAFVMHNLPARWTDECTLSASELERDARGSVLTS